MRAMSRLLPAGSVFGNKTHGLGQRAQTVRSLAKIAGAQRRLLGIDIARLSGGRGLMRPFEHITGHTEQPAEKFLLIVIHDVCTVALKLCAVRLRVGRKSSGLSPARWKEMRRAGSSKM